MKCPQTNRPNGAYYASSIASKTVLLTSFTTWEAHHRSNSSDDLLEELLKTDLPPSVHCIRQLPVDFDLAPQQAIAHFNQFQPDIMICCGMAENRPRLNVESQAIIKDEIRRTSLDLDRLIHNLKVTDISHDAGQFVCNALYFAMLSHVQRHSPQSQCLFVHVPRLTADNMEAIVADFQHLLYRLMNL
jgi:pyroglutamyl-peptidase